MTDRLDEIRRLIREAPYSLQDPTGHVFVIDGVDDDEQSWKDLPAYRALIAAAPELLAWCVERIAVLEEHRRLLRLRAQRGAPFDFDGRCITCRATPYAHDHMCPHHLAVEGP